MSKKRVLTGVTTTGIPHLGNYVGAIRPAVRAAQNPDTESFLFLADYHGIIKCHEPEMIHQSTQAVAATWLACGLDPKRTTFYRQSDIPEIMELNWILTCITAKGLMNRAHAYKAAVQTNTLNFKEVISNKILEIENLVFEMKAHHKDYQSKKGFQSFDSTLELERTFGKIRGALSFFAQEKHRILLPEKKQSELDKILNDIQFPHKIIKNTRTFNSKIKKFNDLINQINKHLKCNHSDVIESIAADDDTEMGLYSYPILMTADILMFNANEVPVGRDQIQHVEMARDIAGRFNYRFKEVFTLPEVKIDENVELLVGLDGRKMSKSYGNTIPLWENDKKTQKSVNKIITNMKEPGEPKQPDESPLFEIYKAFSTPSETAAFTQMLAEGLAWGEAKKLLAAKINAELAEPRERYNELTANPSQIEDILQAGAAKARKEARELLDKVRDAVGIRPLK